MCRIRRRRVQLFSESSVSGDAESSQRMLIQAAQDFHSIRTLGCGLLSCRGAAYRRVLPTGGGRVLILILGLLCCSVHYGLCYRTSIRQVCVGGSFIRVYVRPDFASYH